MSPPSSMSAIRRTQRDTDNEHVAATVTSKVNEQDKPEMKWLAACAKDSPAVKGHVEEGQSALSETVDLQTCAY